MGKKISDLPNIVTPALSDVFPVIQSGVTYKETMAQLSSLFATGFSVKANTTDIYGGGGTSNGFTATGIDATSIVTATILTSANAVSIAKAVPSANTLTVTFTADPGAGTTVSWIAITPDV